MPTEELLRERKRLHGLMVFFASVSAATEKVFGSSAEVITGRLGKQPCFAVPAGEPRARKSL